MKRRSLFALGLLALLFGCSGSSIVTLVDAGVAAFEAIIPAIPSNLTPAQLQDVANYTDAGLQIFTELIDNGVSTGSIAVAVDKASKLVAPSVGQPAGGLILAADAALHAFISAAQGATVTAENDIMLSPMIHAAFPAGKTIKLTSRHKAKLAEIAKRAHASRNHLEPYRRSK